MGNLKHKCLWWPQENENETLYNRTGNPYYIRGKNHSHLCKNFKLLKGRGVFTEINTQLQRQLLKCPVKLKYILGSVSFMRVAEFPIFRRFDQENLNFVNVIF